MLDNAFFVTVSPFAKFHNTKTKFCLIEKYLRRFLFFYKLVGSLGQDCYQV